MKPVYAGVLQGETAQTFFEALPDPVILLNSVGLLIAVNTQTERLFGYARHNLLGQPITVLLPARFHPDSTTRLGPRVSMSDVLRLDGGTVLCGLRQDGSEFPLAITYRPYTTAQGQCLMGVIRDLTVRHHVHELGEPQATTPPTLREYILEGSRHLLPQIVHAMPGIVYLYDIVERQTVYANQRLHEVLGYSMADLQRPGGHILRPLLHPEDFERYTEHFRALLHAPEHQVLEFEGRLRHANGTWVWLCIRDLVLRRQPDGTPRLTLGVAHDCTARKQQEEALRDRAAYDRHLNLELAQREQERTAQLAAANQELEALCYAVSHDLRAPLRAIDGFSQALLEDHLPCLDAEGQHYLRRVRAAGQRMGALIDALLNLARMTRHTIHRTTVHLSAVATTIATELSYTQPQRHVDWHIAPHVFVEADRTLMRIVLEHLLGNAWKYTSQHARARIEFGVTTQHGSKVYFVRDDGAGFDMAYADKLFGAFQRLHRRDEFEGIGIGLAIVERIIHRHGGKVWAAGAVEQGAIVSFTL